MASPVAAPDDAHLASLGLESEADDEPWVRSVTLRSESRGTVTLTWDEVAASAHVIWVDGDDAPVVELSRETVDTITVEPLDDGFLVTVSSRSEGLVGLLTIAVTRAAVRLHDRLLRA